jgi:hypothetical protein
MPAKGEAVVSHDREIPPGTGPLLDPATRERLSIEMNLAIHGVLKGNMARMSEHCSIMAAGVVANIIGMVGGHLMYGNMKAEELEEYYLGYAKMFATTFDQTVEYNLETMAMQVDELIRQFKQGMN